MLASGRSWPTALLPLRARLAGSRAPAGREILRRLFEPLGYAVHAVQHPLDEQFPEWGESPYFTVELDGRVRLRELLSHLYVLVPVLDTTSTTGSATPRSRSCCATARGGWPPTPSAS